MGPVGHNPSVPRRLPRAFPIWAVLLTAALSFGIFEYKEHLQVSGYEYLLPLQECVRELDHRVSLAQIHLERFLDGEKGVREEEATAALSQAEATARACDVQLRRQRGMAQNPIFTERMDALFTRVSDFRELGIRRLALEAPSPVLETQQYMLFGEISSTVGDIRNDLRLRGYLLERRRAGLRIALLVAWGAFAALMCWLLGIHSRRERCWQQLVAAGETRLRGIMSLFPDPVAVLDEDGTIVDIPSENSALLPSEPSAMAGQPIYRFLPEEAARETADLLKATALDGESRTMECRLDLPDGPREVECTIIDFGRDEERCSLLLWTAHDLTSRRRSEERRIELERRLRNAERMESLGIMAGGVAHDFDNLLTGILGNTEMAMAAVKGDHDVTKLLREVHDAAGRAAGIAGKMLAYSGNSHQRNRPFDFGKLLSDLMPELQAKTPKQVELRVICPPSTSTIHGDPDLVRQVIWDLVFNAVEAIGDDKGRVTLRVDERDCDAAYFDRHPFEGHCVPGRYLRLRVTDTGGGIPGDVVRRIFDPFFTTKFTGRGLGLAAVHGIVRSHDGALRAASSPGRGTRFEILFPLRDRD